MQIILPALKFNCENNVHDPLTPCTLSSLQKHFNLTVFANNSYTCTSYFCFKIKGLNLVQYNVPLS